jgi:myosin-5
MLMHSSQWTQGGADPKSFCTTILDKTLTDPDKYQIGLTKVFLRAGMLAYLESRRLDRLNSLATIIQKNFKRTMGRNRYLRLRKSSIKLQTWWRGIMAKRFVLAIRKEVAARRLQAAARRFVQRRKFLEVQGSVIKLQARKFKFHLGAGLTPGPGIRGANARKTFRSDRIQNAAIKLQSLLRGACVPTSCYGVAR